jgi:NADPH:quinone reductase-like Zn-dependent oxidoreductase
VLVKVHATTVTRTDSGLLRANPFLTRFFLGLFRPKLTTLGLDFAGKVERVGPGLTAFKPGDRVFGMSPDRYGAHAEYLCVPERGTIATMPAGLCFREAVVCEGAWYADSTLRAFGLGPGHSILIYGASGAIGTAAVQLARSYGAEVTAVAATQHLELVRSLGAEHVIDYTVQNFTKIGQTFDFVFDAVGKTTYFRCRSLLKPSGKFAASDLGPWWQNLLLATWSSITRSNRVLLVLPMNPQGLVESLKKRMEANELRAVIDREYPFEAISDAYRYVETGMKVGIVVINLPSADQCGLASRAV